MSGKTMYQAVRAMNVAFGNATFGPLPFNSLTSPEERKAAWERLEKQCWAIGGNGNQEVHGELKELHDALAERNITKVRDALCDLMVFILGAYHFTDYDAEQDMQCVLDGVMTRFCRDEAELKATIAKYDAMGVATYHGGSFPYVWVKSYSDQTDVGGEHYPKGKFLKSVGFKEPTFFEHPEVLRTVESRSRTFIGSNVTAEMGKEREIRKVAQNAWLLKRSNMLEMINQRLDDLDDEQRAKLVDGDWDISVQLKKLGG